ncbi:rubrerythrin family protein [Streptomyces viridifaciens]|nr:ferritin family protein [Kitasatospora aureofaciens]UKZ10064.1 rubrerythrin family protein [Streptomyces viridifaciens]
MTAYPIRALVTSTLAVSVALCAGVTAAPAAASPAVTGTAIPALQQQTRTNLAQAMRGEAFANVSYTLFAAQAQREGRPAVADLFRKAAAVELGEHFTQEAAPSGLVGGNEANLTDAISGEGYESTTMYPTFARQARAAGDTAAADLFTEIAKDEAAHQAAYKAALTALRSGKGAIPAPPAITPVTVTAGQPKVTSAQTRANLDTAMHGEALAHAKYTLYAQRAQQSGNAALARLFTAVSDVELQEHFSGEAALAGSVGTTSHNLATAIAGETYESKTMYPTFAQQAKTAGDTAAATLFQHNATDEADHAQAFQTARKSLG